jgi:DNA-binding NarL/FixJ family response regulator
MNAHSLSSPPTAIERRLTAAARRPIRVLLIDDHPTVLAGLAGVLDDDPGITAAATATSARDGLAQARRLVLDAVVVDYYLPGEDGLWLVPRLKALRPSPGVVLYSVYACPAMTVAAILAGADGVLSKSARAEELCHAIRAVADGRKAMPPLRPSAMLALAELDPDDARLSSMIIDGASPRDLGAALGISEAWIDARRWAILERLRSTLRGV